MPGVDCNFGECASDDSFCDSPGINAGRGLKPNKYPKFLADMGDSPGINAGRGLKQT